jgi:hypothetical protein
MACIKVRISAPTHSTAISETNLISEAFGKNLGRLCSMVHYMALPGNVVCVIGFALCICLHRVGNSRCEAPKLFDAGLLVNRHGFFGMILLRLE